MKAQEYARLAAIAEQRWGLITTAQAAEAGVSRLQMSRLAAAERLIRVIHGVYRIAGAPESEHEQLRASWLALGGATLEPTDTGVPAVVAGGITAASLHNIGDFWPAEYDFIVPRRRGTRLPNVRLRVRRLTAAEVVPVDGLPILTVERTIADLVGLWTDLSLVADAVRDAILQGKLVSRSRLAEYLAPLAAANDLPTGDGEAFTSELIDMAGVDPAIWAGHV